MLNTFLAVIILSFISLNAFNYILLRPDSAPPDVSLQQPELAVAFKQVLSTQTKIHNQSNPQPSQSVSESNHQNSTPASLRAELEKTWSDAIVRVPALSKLDGQIRNAVACSRETESMCAELLIDLADLDDLPLELAQQMKEHALQDSQLNASAHLAAIEAALNQTEVPEGLKIKLTLMKASLLRRQGEEGSALQTENRLPASDTDKPVLTNPELTQ